MYDIVRYRVRYLYDIGRKIVRLRCTLHLPQVGTEVISTAKYQRWPDLGRDQTESRSRVATLVDDEVSDATRRGERRSEIVYNGEEESPWVLDAPRTGFVPRLAPP